MDNATAGAVILLYHGVTDAPSRGIENFSGKHIRAGEFDRQMALIAENAVPMSLREMAARLADGESLPPGSVAVTFDDSFKNKSQVALPILKRHGVPATFFITTGFIGTDNLYWTDRVEHCINDTDAGQITLDVGSGEQSYSLRSEAEKIDAVIAIKTSMKALAPTERDRVLADLHTITGVGVGAGDVANYRQLNWDDVRALDAGADYDVGGHSVNHEILSYLTPDRLAAEINDCQDALERELGHRVDLFSYPEGQAAHFNGDVIEALKRRGVSVSPSAIAGTNQPGANPFYLRRIMVGFMGTPFPYPEYVD